MELFARLAELERRGEAGVLLTVVRTAGSTPRKSAAKMLVLRDATVGTIGGGKFEHEAIAAARELLAEGYAARPTLRRWHLTHDLAMCCGGEMEVFMEPLFPAPRLFVCGGGHVARALVPIAATLGFRCTVVEDEEALLGDGRANFPAADAFADDFDPARWSGLDADAYVVVVTRDHAIDQKLMESLMTRELAYLGLIGSRRKIALFKDRLAARGIEEARWEQVHAPIGVDIGADTPEEIAVAIAAELVQERARRRKG